MNTQLLEEPGLAIETHAEMAYLRYAMSVIRDRALPEVADGQKPSQRRILYAMHALGLTTGVKAVKCARIIGEVIGKYHPHGDTASYGTMVRMAQDFSLRYPLIDGQGNFGSRDGANPAAMRYTEARLTPIAELLLSELNQGTVDFVPNYDGAFQEPKLLPARLPMLLLNGASGIAVGMATEIPSHNLVEVAHAAVALINDPSLTLSELMQHLPGPDFPGGGQLVADPAAIRAAYESGRGTLRVRARWVVEQLARKDWQIVVTELPHGVSAQTLLSEIDTITNPKLKASQKKLTQQQLDDKQRMLALLDKVRDEAGRNYAVRLVIEPKSNKQDPAALMQTLLACTSLETSVPLNLVTLGLDGNPRQTGLREILADWITFRFITVTRRTQHRLDQVSARMHILAGRLICFLNLEAVIKLIREADDAKGELMARFGLSDVQALDILEIRLRQLSRLERVKIEGDIQVLQTEKTALEALLGSKAAMQKQIVAEIKADSKQFGDSRHTLIEAAAPVQAGALPQDMRPITVVLSKNGWLRCLPGHDVDPAALLFKAGDSLLALAVSNTAWPFVLLDDRGRTYSLTAEEIPADKDGVPVSALRDTAGGKIQHLLCAAPDSKFLLAQSGGYGFITGLSDMVTRLRAGKAFMTLEPGELILPPAQVTDDTVQLAAWSANGRLLLFPLAEMKLLANGGRGVIVMGLDAGEGLLGVRPRGLGEVALESIDRGGKVQLTLIPVSEQGKYMLHRARKGALLPKRILITRLT